MISISKRPYFSSLVLCVVMFSLVAIQLAAGLVAGPAAAQTPSYVRIKNKWQNTYLYQASNQVRYGTPAASDTSAHWVLEAYAGSTRIKNRASGNYMAIEHLYDYVEAIAIQDTWESARWTVSDAPSGGGYKIIRNVWNNWKVLHIENLRGYAQTGDIPTSWDSPQWLLEPVSGTNPTATPVPPTATPTRTPTPGPTATPGPTSTPQPTPQPGSNLALGKPITASSTVHTFVATNANDNSLTTYWEGAGGSYPNTLTVSLGANANLSSVVVKLNPDAAWSTRTQTIAVQGRDQSGTTFNTLKAAATYTFNPASGNSVTIPVSGTAADVRLVFTSNSGAPAGQAAEFQIFGSMAPNPDLTITGMSWTPSAPSESQAITLQATVRNGGSAGSGATTVNFSLNGSVVGSANVGALAAGASTNVSLNIGTRTQGSYSVSSVVDPGNTIVEQNDNNNSFSSSTSLNVAQAPGPDLQVVGVSMNPQSPAAGAAVSFIVSVNNRGTTGVAAGTTTRVVVGTTTLNNASTPAIAAGATVNVTVGTWTAVNGSTALTATADATNIVAETSESNNSFTQQVAVGRGAIMPYTKIEAEAASVATNGTRLTPNYRLADLAGEASGRSAVMLDATGEYTEFTLTSSANALVLRNSIPNSADGAGIDSTVTVYVGGVNKGKMPVSSKFSYVYTTPTNLGQLGYNNTPGGTAYWLYEEANMMLDQVYPAGTKIRIQKDAGDVQWISVDFLETENVAPAAGNPDPTRYVQVSSTKNIDAALQEFRADSTKLGIFIPAGNWTINSKIFLYGRATQIIGAGPWHTRLIAPQDQTNTDVGFNISSQANGSVLKNFSVWGNYRYRVDGPGKFIDGNGMQNVTVENIWAEHFVCLYWGVNSSNNTFRNLRIRNTFADGINMTNGSSNNLITNSESRGAGDDAFALFSAIDAGGSYNVGNRYTNLTAILVRRAAAFAVYGGSGNLYQNLYGADTLTYPGITISSLSFGYNTLGFGDQDNVFDGVTLERTGGDFWTSVGGDDKINDYQNFAAIWFFAGDRPFRNIVVKNVDINNPVYFGVMFQTKYPEKPAMQNVRLENININNAPRYGIKLVIRAEGSSDTPPVGAVSFTNVKVNNAGVAPIYGEGRAPEFTINRISGNNW
ncbi:MAG TPA: CARDB domain-containing protein [Herpetosiphonaceae bacterium]